MKKTAIFLCSITAAVLMAGCGSVMPDLTQEETETISEYAAGVLLKHDRVSGGRLMSMSEFESEEIKKMERETKTDEKEPEQAVEESGADSSDDAEVVDVSQDEETATEPSSIEEFYGIQDFTFQYAGYELTQSYPSGTEGEIFFSMDATDGTDLLVMKFTVSNTSSSDQTLNMLDHEARFRVSVNGAAGENALSTMLLNDLQSYDDVVPAGSSVELVSVIEVPQSTVVETIDLMLRGETGTAVIRLQ